MENSEKEGERLKNKLKGAGIEINSIADKLKMTRQNVGYHFRKNVLDSTFKQKLKDAFPSFFTNDKSGENDQFLQLNVPNLENNENVTKKLPISNAITLGEIIYHEDESPYIDLNNGNFLMVVPKIPIRASAGYRENYQDENYVNTQFEKHYFTVPGNHYRGRYFSFVIEGDSMENYTSQEMARASIPDGSVATGREIQRQHWKNKFHLKSFQDYIIVHRDVILAKRILDHNTETGVILCHSLNPDKQRHPDFEILLDECLQILNIVDVSQPR